MEDRERRALAFRSRELRVELARRDANAFMPLVLRDEETNKPIKQALYHSDWQRVLSENNRVVLWSHVESGKTQQISVGRVLWELGVDPTLRCVIVAATSTQAVKITKSIGRYITSSDELHSIFPNLRPARSLEGSTAKSGWAQDSLTVQRETHAKDPSVQATCLHGNILGARIDLLILDDLLTFETTRTEYMRQDTIRWIDSTLMGRLTRRGRVVFIGNAWHREDAMQVLSRRVTWNGFRFPVMDTETSESNWPDRWPKERIDEKRLELGPLEFARQMQCEARAEGESRFHQADIDICLAAGAGMNLMPRFDAPEGWRVYTGVDLAVKKSATAHLTVMFTIALLPDGKRRVLNIESGKWSAQEILQRLCDTQDRFSGLLVVENNAAQDFLVQMAQTEGLMVKPFNTGRNKAHPLFGVESMSAEMSRGDWVIPSGEGQLHPEVSAWVDEMLYYDPQSHTGDRLMASWFAREAARKDMGAVHRVAAVGMDGKSIDDYCPMNADEKGLIDFWEEVGSSYGQGT